MKWYLSVMEDIISVLDGRPEIIEAVKGAETELKQYLKDRLAGLLRNQNFIKALPGHLPPDSGSGRLPVLTLTRKALPRYRRVSGWQGACRSCRQASRILYMALDCQTASPNRREPGQDRKRLPAPL